MGKVQGPNLKFILNLLFIHLFTMARSELNSLIANHLNLHRPLAAIAAFDSSIPHHRTTTTYNLALSSLVRTEQIPRARKLFDEIPQPDAVSYNILLSSLPPPDSFRLFLRMLRLRVGFTASTLSSVLSSPPDPAVVPQAHTLAIKSGLSSNTFVGTPLITGYAKLKDASSLMRALEEIETKNSVTWTAAITALMGLGRVGDARRMLDLMPEPTTAAQNALLQGYITNSDLTSAREIFDNVHEKNVVTWTSMITGYNKFGRFADALNLFSHMDVDPNPFTYSAALSSSAGIPSFASGGSIHARILKSGTSFDTVLSTSLLEMYGKCGDADAATRVFEECGNRNVATWNSVIGACARNGRPNGAVEFAERMVTDNETQPDGVTMVNVLTACVHGGMVEEGEKWFGMMEREFGIRKGIEHYGCMVDLYARAGREEEARRIADEMPLVADRAVVGGGYERSIRECGERGELGRMGELKEERERVVGNKKGRGVSRVESCMLKIGHRGGESRLLNI